MIELIPVKAHKVIIKYDDLLECITKSLDYNNLRLNDTDILIVSSKIIAITENRIVNLNDVLVSSKAKELASNYSLDARLTELIINEADVVYGGVPKVLLTLKNNNLIANAGIDKSNSGGNDLVVLWPKNPYDSAEFIRNYLIPYYSLKNLGVIVSDSHINPLRQGVVGSAIGVAGLKPVEDCVGRKDLFNHVMEYTKRAITDQVVTAAHLITGECDERIPLVIAKGVRAEFCDERVNPSDIYMPFEKCLFMNSLRTYFKEVDSK